MQIKDLMPWNTGGRNVARQTGETHPVFGLQREMNRVFDAFWDRFDRGFGGFGDLGIPAAMPRADVVDTGKAVEISAELPGLSEKDVDVQVTEDAVIIKGEKKAENEERRDGVLLSERSYGAFHRTVPLPPGTSAEGAEAVFRNGVLTVKLPKTEESAGNARRIEVKAA